MEEENLNFDINRYLPKNLATLRKHYKMTQGEVAEKIGYSDKTLSKWEKGDAVPDVETLYSLSQLYQVQIDDLLTKEIKITTQLDEKQTEERNFKNKIIITALTILLVWLTAVVIFTEYAIVFDTILWRVFIWAIPITCVVLYFFNKAWGKKQFRLIIASAFIWTILLAIHMQFLQHQSMWCVYILGVPLQITLILLSQLTIKPKTQQNAILLTETTEADNKEEKTLSK